MSARRCGRWVAIVVAAATAAAAACSDSTGPRSGPPATLTVVAGNNQAGLVGSALDDRLTVQVRDSDSVAVSGAQVRWSVDVDDGRVDPVTATTNRDGVATATWTLGTSTARHGGVTATVANLPPVTFVAARRPGAVATVTVASPTDFVYTTTSTRLTASARDQYGNAIGDAVFVWSSSSLQSAYVDENGTVYGTAVGATATITATTGGKSGGVVVRVIERPLALVTLALEQPRAAVAFDTTFTAIGGGGGYRWRLTAGQLPGGLTLESGGRLRGVPSQSGPYAFTVAVRDTFGVEVARAFAVEVCNAPVNLLPGQSITWRFPDGCGVALPDVANAMYRVGVMARGATAPSGAALVPGGLQLRTIVAGPSVAASRTTIAARVSGNTPDGVADEATWRLIRSTEAVHMRLREEEIGQFGSLPRRPLGPPLAQLGIRATITAPQPMRTFYISNPAGGARLPVTATLRLDAANVIYYEDDAVVGTAERATDEEIAAIVSYYDQFGKPVIDDAFGGLGPAGTTSDFRDGPRTANDLDGNGKFIVLQLTQAHMLSGAAAYVSSCDRLPLPTNAAIAGTSCNLSNEAEMTYMLRPNSFYYRGVIVHEAKHIASHGYARYAARGFNPSWIEEGTAEIAAEMSSRRAAGIAERAEARRGDVFPGGTSPTAETYYMYIPNTRARSFLLASPLSSLMGDPNPNPNGSTYYGASWLFHRYLADHYAVAGDVAFFRQLNVNGTGTAAIETATGTPFADLLAEFMAAIAVEGSQQKQAATYRFVSYDFADVATRFGNPAWPFAEASVVYPTTSFPMSTYYTAPNMFEFTSAPGRSLRLDLLQGGGTPLAGSSDGVLTILRVR